MPSVYRYLPTKESRDEAILLYETGVIPADIAVKLKVPEGVVRNVINQSDSRIKQVKKGSRLELYESQTPVVNVRGSSRKGGWPVSPVRVIDLGKKKHSCSVCGEPSHTKSVHLNIGTTEKQCSRCEKLKPFSEFSLKDSRIVDGVELARYYANCKDCDRARSKFRKSSSFEARFNGIVTTCNQWSRKRGVKSEIDVEFIRELFQKQSGLCFYTGEPMKFESGIDSVSMDRRDSNIGYRRDNVVLCRWITNSMKGSFNMKDFISTCQQIAEQSKKENIWPQS